MDNMKRLYTELCGIQKMLWKDDDRMEQDTLFAVQDKFANVLLQVASKAGMVDDLVQTFPYLYEVKGE